MNEEANALPEEVVTGVGEPQGMTEIPNGVNIPVGEQVPETPKEAEKILGKFDNQEALVKAYQELESKLGNNEPKEETTNSSDEIVNEDGEFDISKYSNEYAENGKLSESSYQELKEVGFTKDIVDAYIKGQAAIGDQWQATVKGMVGSEDDYKELITWASQGGVDEDFIKQYDEAVGSMDKNKAMLAVEALKSLYSQANNEPALLEGSTLGSGLGDVYESWAQLTEDLNSPLYHKDPAERERVQRKISRSKL